MTPSLLTSKGIIKYTTSRIAGLLGRQHKLQKCVAQHSSRVKRPGEIVEVPAIAYKAACTVQVEARVGVGGILPWRY